MGRFVWPFILILAANVAFAQTAATRYKPLPVRFDGQTLFNIYTPLDTLRPEERVSVIENRLDEIAATGLEPVLSILPTEFGDSVIFENSPLVTVTKGDAEMLSQNATDLAREYESRILEAVNRYHADREPSRALFSVLAAVAIGAITGGLVIAIVRITFRWEVAVIGTLSREERRAHTFHHAIGSLRNLAMLLVVFVGATSALAVMPWTRDFTDDINELFRSRLTDIRVALAHQAENISFLVTIAAITWLVLIITRAIFDAISAGRMKIGAIDSELAPPTYRILRVFVIVVAFVAAYPYIPGSATPAFQGISVFLGALFSLGSSNVVGNVVAGLLSTYTRPFRPGDYVKIGETSGFILGKSDLVTRVRTITNIEVTIPNSMLLSAPVFNYTAAARGNGLMLTIACSIGYREDWERVVSCLQQAAKVTDGVLETPAPFVLQKTLNDASVSFELCAYTRAVETMHHTESALIANIQNELDKAGVNMVTPAYIVLNPLSAITEPAKPAP